MRILDDNRNKYKRTFLDGGCIFCADENLECKGLRGKHWTVIVNRYPYMDGNVMIISIRHAERIEELSEDEWGEFGKVLTGVQDVLGRIFKTDSFNVGLNLGKESGASIPHLHWQVIPRQFKNITAMNTFADLYIVKTTPEETKRLIDRETSV